MVGVYILKKSFRGESKPLIYVGESVGLYSRLITHKGYVAFNWDEAYAFYSVENRITKAHARCIEQSLIAAANSNCMLQNDHKIVKVAGVNDLTQLEADEFTDNVIEVCCLLGVDFLDRRDSAEFDGVLFNKVRTEAARYAKVLGCKIDLSDALQYCRSYEDLYAAGKQASGVNAAHFSRWVDEMIEGRGIEKEKN